ncbi:MAG: FecR domain-containing protein [Crocosphaera sp.]|nr:FecR domain-containing protein [Crocosphaera sp.]
MSKPLINQSIQCLIGLSCLGLLEITPLLAQTRECGIISTGEGELTCANVYKTEKEVFPKPYLATEQTLETKDNARAKLQFNEGSIARMGANAQFYFSGGDTFGTVTEGTVLVAVLRGAQKIAVNTPNTQITHTGTVYILRYDSENNESLIRVLGGKLKVSNRDGSQSVDLKAGELLTVEQDFVGSPQSFDLEAFYQEKENPESELAEGFGPGQEDSISQEPRSVQNAMYLLRTDTFVAVRSQTRTFPGRDYRRRFLNDALIGTHDSLRGVPNDTRIHNPKQIADADSPISATLRVEAVVDGDIFRVPFPGQLTEDGNFSFVTPRIEGSFEGVDLSNLPSAEISFYVGTTNLTSNAPIPTRGNFVDAVLTNPVIQDAVFRATNGRVDFRVLDRNEALAIIQSATVTPQGVPIPATTDAGTFIPIITDSGPVFVGPIMDR